jgi:DNA-binding winged helix-turn-helix (wHTH) protein
MLYIFKDFKFDSDSLLLTKSGEPIDIRLNEIRLLALLLEHSDKVLSKEKILSYIWQDKVVSEQAVFQNISHLRNVFGNDAIKTFSKRGYQWQLEFETATSTQPAENIPQAFNQAPQPKPSIKRPFWFYGMLASFIFALIMVTIFQTESNQNSADPVIKLAYIPISVAENNSTLTLENNVHFDFTALTHLNTEQFQTSIELEYPLQSTTHSFVLSAEIRTFNQQFYLDFLLKGPFADWQGQVSAESQEEIINKLLQHLQQAVIYDLLNKPLSPDLKLASLTIAHQIAPTDLIILGKLINTYSETDELEKAMVMAEKLVNIASIQNNQQQMGNALLYQSEILTRKKLFDLSLEKLNLAIEQFASIGDLKRQADAWVVRSWLDPNDDYTSVKTSLLKAASLAFQANDKLRELDAIIYLSKMAYKHQQTEDSYRFLRQAENKMKDYQLPIYHFGIVPFHYAIFAKEPSDKEPHLEQVLEFTALTPDVWYSKNSRIELMSYYIKQNRLIEAQALVDTLTKANMTTDKAKNSYLKTLLAQAKQQPKLMISLAKKTFEQAQLAGERNLSLDVALLLCNTTNAQLNHDFYTQYIQENATDYWRQDNEAKLMALNL